MASSSLRRTRFISRPAHRGRLEDQQCPMSTSPVHDRAEHGADRSIGRVESGSVDLALQHQDLVAEGEDLGIAAVTGGKQPSETPQNQSSEGRQRRHESRMLSTDHLVETPGNTRRMSIWHRQERFDPGIVEGVADGARGVGEVGAVDHRCGWSPVDGPADILA